MKSLNWIRKLFITVNIIRLSDGYKRAEYLKSQKIFKLFGQQIYWYTRNIPSEPACISLHNNIKIATGVYFCTHDIIDLMLNDDKSVCSLIQKDGVKNFTRHFGEIEIFDNVLDRKSVV